MREYILERNGCRLRLQAITKRIVRVSYTAEAAFSTRKSLMLVDYPREEADFDITEINGSVCLSTGAMTVEIDTNTLACRYLNAEGKAVLKERAWRPRDLERIEVFRYEQDAETIVRQKTTQDGVRVDARRFGKRFDRYAYHTKLYIDFAKDEAVMGFGSHEEGYLNLRGRNRFLYQQNMKACVPFFWSTAGYGMLIDSYTDMTFHDDGYGSYIWTDVDDEMDYYVILGDGFDEIIHGYRYLTGSVPMPPRYSFGYCQSKERYKTADELIDIVREYRKREIPLDLIILDWKSWVGELWGEKEFDRSRFPDPKAMTEELHRLNAKLMVSIWPHMATGGSNYNEMKAAGMLLADESTYNAFEEKGRALYWKQANEGLYKYGIDAWWCDCTEPFEADWIDSPFKPEPEARQRMNVGEASTYADPEIMAAYSLLHSMGMYEGQRSVSDRRVLNLTRSSYAGQQRYGTFTWSGDISANWETLHKQIAEGLSFVSSGCPYWTLDIGGFFVKDWMQWYGDGHYNEGTADPAYRELYVRWFEYGAFLPMMRSHGTDFAREVWRFGEPGSREYEALCEAIRLRYRLLPYIYSLAYRVSAEDYTMMRPLAADFADDPRAIAIDDQFMFGPSLMVCPVYEPGATSRRVYLPEGRIWYDFYTGRVVPCGEQTVPAPFERIPVFVPGGSILPLGPVVQFSGERVESPLEIRVYAGRDAAFTLYDDDGETYACEQGTYGLRTLNWNDTERKLGISGAPYADGIYRCPDLRTQIFTPEEA